MTIGGTRAFLLAYDIKDPRRLQMMHRFMVEEGLAIQFSLFGVVWSESEMRRAEEGIRDRLDWTEDDVRIYPIPERCAAVLLGPEPVPHGIQFEPAGLELFKVLMAGATSELTQRKKNKGNHGNTATS